MGGVLSHSNPIPLPLQAKLGVQRDGTRYRSDAFLSAQWTRFYNGYPEKIGGYTMVDLGNDEIVAGMYDVPRSVSNDIYLGRASSLHFFNINRQEEVGDEISRTPTTGFTPDPNNTWSFGLVSTVGESTFETLLVAQVAPSRDDLSSQIEGPVFIGNINDINPLVPLVDSTTHQTMKCSGGVVTLNTSQGSIIVLYGNNGQLRWNKPGDLEDFSGMQFISKTKIVKGIEYFGSLLFWTIGGSLVQCIYEPDGEVGKFSSNVIMNNISIISSQSVVQYNQLVFWIGNGQFYVFNGTVGRVTNYMSSKYFFDTLDEDHQSKCFGFVLPKFDEIWFFFPKRNANLDPQLECNAAVVYTVSRQIWHDVQLSRSCALLMNSSPRPIMTSSEIVNTLNESESRIISTYPIWEHEKGFDEVDKYVRKKAIHAHFEYPIIDLFSSQPSSETNRLITSVRIEPDFITTTPMSVVLKSRMFAQDQVDLIGPFVFDGETPYIDINVANSQGRLLSVEFMTDELGSYFICGKNIHDIIPGDFNPMR